ncbi:MAG TPA: hypothetical protein VMC48_06345 [Methanobacterium sp.]|nr:hypothetical protein [Methanobacterium sp.]
MNTNLNNLEPDANPIKTDHAGLISTNPCLSSSISGRYNGDRVNTPGNVELDLRVDITPRYKNSPVLNKISGDFYHIKSYCTPGVPKKCLQSTVYIESWIVNNPKVVKSKYSVTITGEVKYFKGKHPKTLIKIVIPWTKGKAGPADVEFTENGKSTNQFSCEYKSDCFRDMNLEVDICRSVDKEPILPTYDTYAHSDRPANIPQRILTIKNVYRETGVFVTVRSDHTTIDDSNPKFKTWNIDELNDALTTYFSQYTGSWPKWEMWGLLAGNFDEAGVAGIMFDYQASTAPQRQGFAVFRNHTFFHNLLPDTPTNDAQAASMRYLLYCYVHEAGHAFNMYHSWDKNRPESLSWMNYDWKYDQIKGSGQFWKNFEFRFDDDELIHIRHDDLYNVEMGGDAWGTGGHLESPPGAMVTETGESPLEFEVRSKGYFDLMEPVNLELKLKNLMEIPVSIDTNLKPDFGNTTIYIQNPHGDIIKYNPVTCMISSPDIKELKPFEEGVSGEDSHHDTVFVNYGSGGFYFKEPGDYLVKAVYHGLGDILITSNIHKLSVGSPTTGDENRLVHKYFNYPVGMALYVKGSASPYLESGMELLESIVKEEEKEMLKAKIAARISPGIAREFFRIQEGALQQTYRGDPEKALDITDTTVELFRTLTGRKAKALNIDYHKVVRGRAKLLTKLGKKDDAKQEISTLINDLEERDVKESVLTEIKAYQDSL